MKKSILTTICILSSLLTFAQVPSAVDLVQPSTVQVCETNSYTGSFPNGLGTTFTLQINPFVIINTNTFYSANCANAGTNNIGEIVIDNSSLQGISFNPTGNVNEWSVTVINIPNSFEFDLLIDCSITTNISTSGANAYVNTDWLINSGSNINTTSANVQLEYPFLVDVTPTTFNGNYQGTLGNPDLYFSYLNTGSSSNILFDFNDIVGCVGTYSILNVAYDIGPDPSPTSTIYTYSNPLTLPANNILINIPLGHYLHIREQVEITGCLRCEMETIEFSWHCFSTSQFTNACTSCQEQFNTQFDIIHDGNRQLTMRRATPTLSVARTDHSCPGVFTDWDFFIENTGTTGIFEGNFNLYYHGTNNGLVMIDRSSLIIDASTSIIILEDPNDIALQTPVSLSSDCFTPWPNATLCNNSGQVPDPFQQFQFDFRELPPGESIRIRFRTYKCVEEAGQLLNNEKVFNNWIMGLGGISECGTVIPVSNAASPNQAFLTDIGGISLYAFKLQGIDQLLSFSPSIGNLTAITPTCSSTAVTLGPAVNFSMDLDGLSLSAWEAQTFGCGGSQGSDMCSPSQGFLRARISTDPGLYVSTPITNEVSLTFGGQAFLPFHSSASVIYDATDECSVGCHTGIYDFYYDLSDVTNPANFLNAGSFNFRLNSCCGPFNQAHSNYDVTFSLLPNPSGGCYSKATVSGTSTLEWLPLSADGDFIDVQCPGCGAPGIDINHYNLHRTTYGYIDDDDDGIADIPLTPVSPNYTNFGDIDTLSSFHGDLLEDQLIATFIDGETPDGYLYEDDMFANGAILRWLHLERVMQHKDATTGLNIRITDINFYIDAPTQTPNPANCRDCNAFGGAANNNFETMVHMQTATNIQQYLPILNTDMMYFSFFDGDFAFGTGGSTNPDVVWEHPDAQFQFDRFRVGQRFRLEVHYEFCGNFTALHPADGVRRSIITNFMFLSGTAQPDASTVPDMPNSQAAANDDDWTFGTPPPNPPTMNLVNQNFADSYMFWCETYGGRHYFYATDIWNSSSYQYYPGSCDRYIGISTKSIVGGRNNVKNIFTNEYRIPPLKPNLWIINIDPAFQLSANSRVRTNFLEFTTGSTTNTWGPWNNFGNLTINGQGNLLLNLNALNSFPNGPGCLTSNTATGLVFSDQKLDMEIEINLDEINCGSTAAIPNVTTEFNENNIYCQNMLNAPACQLVQTLTNANTIPLATISPHLVLNQIPSSGIENAIQNTVVWEFTIENQNLPGIPSTQAYNVFLEIPQGVNYLSFTVFRVSPTVAQIQPVVGNPNVFILESVMNSGALNTYELRATYQPCEPEPDPISITWGWNCDGWPAPSGTTPCFVNDFDITLINTPVAMNPQSVQPNQFALCQPFYVKAQFSSLLQGGIYPDGIELLNLPPYLEILECNISDCNGNISPLIVNSPAQTLWTISPGDLAAIGYPNGFLGILNCLEVELKLNPKCQYNGQLPGIKLNTTNYCGNPFSYLADFYNLGEDVPNNACTNCFTISKTPSTNNITLYTTIDFYIDICNFSPTLIPVPSFQVTDIIPPNFVVTSPLPINYLAWPTQPCTTLILSGHFTQIPPGGIAINTAELLLDPPVSGGPFTAQCTLQVASDCATFADQVTIPGHNNSSSYSIQNGWVVYVIEDFIIDQTVSYSNNTFYIDPEVEIIVTDGNSLTLENSKIYACTDMWKGIRVEAGGTLKSADSEICDAEYAIYSEDLSTVILQDSKFFRNYVGLYIPTALTGLNSISTYISNCEFATHGTIRPTYPSQLTVPGNKSLTGIFAHDVILDLGSMYNPNQFYDMSNGLVSFNTTASVTNCIFRNIIPDPQYQPLTSSMAVNTSYNGSAIYALGRFGNLLKQRGFGLNGQISFDNCRFGLFTDRMNVDSRNNNMTDMFTGYRTNFGSNLTMDITGNKIESRSTAIDLRFNDNADHLWVSDNQIHFGEFVSAQFRGISAIQSLEQNGANNDSRIHNNTIYYNSGANNAVNGINLNSTSDYFVTENDLIMDDNLVNINGIIVSGSNNTEISCNVVDGTNNFSAFIHQSAITNVLGSNPVISCNIVDGTMNGIRMVGDAGLNVVMQGNEFNNHNRGLFYNQGITNAQDWQGNLWPDNPVNLTWGAFSDNPIIASFSPYSYDNSNPPLGLSFEPTTSTINPVGFEPPNWFQPGIDSNDETFYCLVNNVHYCDQFPPCPGCPIDIVIHERIARDSIENAPYTAETRWRLKRELYRKLLTDSTLLSITLFEDFYNEMESSVTAQLEQLIDEQYEIMQLDQLVINNLNQNRLTLDVQMALLAEQMELYRLALDAGTDPSAYMLNIQTIRQSMEAVMNYNRNVFVIADSSLILTTDYIRLVNDSIYTSETIEANEQVVNEIYLSAIVQVQLLFSQDTIDQLEVIAYQCPLAGGNAVFRARAILSLISDNYVYDDVNICLQAGIILRQTPKKPIARLYPNPANSSVTLVYELPEGSTAELLLFNSVGMLQLKLPLNSETTRMSFSTEHLTPGVYHYNVNSNNDIQLNGKLVIFH